MQNNSKASGQSTLSRETVLRPLFVSLPMPRGTDPEGLLEGYYVALDGLPLNAVQSVVTKLVKGTWSEPVTFCPRPPELANMIRKEQFNMRERSKPTLPMLPARHDFKDLRVIHGQRAEELARQDYVFFAKCASLDEFARMARRRNLPIGAVCLWAIDEIWAPRSAAKSFQPAEATEEQAEDPNDGLLDAEKAEYWSRIQGLKDAKEISDEQAAFRRKIASELDAVAPKEEERGAA